jgi:steroid delta-isomerase-like uncharacterized protein
MTAAAKKTLVRRYFEEVFNQGRLRVADELFGADYVLHDPASTGLPQGPEAMKRFARQHRAAFPNLRVIVVAQMVDGEDIATRWTSRGTHEGVLMGVPPTGRLVTASGVAIDRVHAGKIVESWFQWDALGLLRQLGAVPEKPPASATAPFDWLGAQMEPGEWTRRPAPAYRWRP